MKYLGLQKYKDVNKPPTATYYNIPINQCYVLFDAIGGDILSLIDSVDIPNSVCVDNKLFKGSGESKDKLPDSKIISNIINHINEFDGIKILKISGEEVDLFDKCDYINDVIPTISQRERENIITDILGY